LSVNIESCKLPMALEIFIKNVSNLIDSFIRSLIFLVKKLKESDEFLPWWPKIALNVSFTAKKLIIVTTYLP
jgi:hypothetical protein